MAEQILAGTVTPGDLPPEYRDLVTLVETARAETRVQELAMEEETVAAMAAAVHTHLPQESPTRWRAPLMLHRLRRLRLPTGQRPKLAIALAATMLAATTGVAFAGALPAPAQNLAASVFGTVGVPISDEDDEREDAEVLAVDTQDDDDDDLGTEVAEEAEAAAPADTGETSTESGPQWLRLAVANSESNDEAEDDDAEDDDTEAEAEDDDAEDEANDDEAEVDGDEAEDGAEDNEAEDDDEEDDDDEDDDDEDDDDEDDDDEDEEDGEDE